MANGAGDTPVPRERESTMRRAGAAVSSGLGNDTLHKGINWTTLAGTIALGVLGYVADSRKDKTDESIKTGVSTELATLRQWKASATDDLKDQQDQIMALREAVAGLKATVDILSRARPEAAQAAAGVEQLLRGLSAGAGSRKLRAEAAAPEPEAVQQLQRELFAPK